MQGYLHSIKKGQSSLELKINLPNLRTKNREDMKIKIKHIDWQPFYEPVVRKKVIKGMRVVEPPTAKDPLEQSCGCVIMDAVLKLLATGKYFSVNKISYAIGCTPTEISSAVGLAIGMPLTDLIDAYRLKRTCELLCYTDITGADIAKLCGFANYNSFSKFFVRETRYTPFAYRRRHQPADFKFIYEW